MGSFAEIVCRDRLACETLRNVFASYGITRMVDDWAQGLPALFVPSAKEVIQRRYGGPIDGSRHKLVELFDAMHAERRTLFPRAERDAARAALDNVVDALAAKERRAAAALEAVRGANELSNRSFSVNK